MSDTDSINFEQLRKETKTILKQCRAQDPDAIERVRRQLPRLRTLDNSQVAAHIKLGDVQHALAREFGYRNWAELKRHDVPVARFLAAVRGGARDRAQDELRHFPRLANESIHAACALGDADAVRHHLANDAGLLTAIDGGWPPLLYACATPFHRLSLRHAFSIHECAMLLLDRGADPNTSTLADPSDSNSGIPAIVRAGMNNNRLVFLLLAQRGALRDQAAAAMKTAFSRINPQQHPLSHAFLNLTEDPAFRDDLNRRLAPILASRPMPQPPSQMSIKGILELERNGSETTRELSLESWRLAIERGVDPSSQSASPADTPLHRMALRNDDLGRSMAELFLTKGADPNAKNAAGETPYSLAVRIGNKPMMDLLLKHGANPESASSADQFIGACRRADATTAWSLLHSEPGLSQTIGPQSHELLLDAVKKNQLDGVRLMANLGFDLAATGRQGATALHIAAWHGYAEMVRLLLELHVPVNSRDLVYGTSPLAWAAHGSNASRSWRESHDDDYCAVANALIKGGADYKSSCNAWGIGPEQVAIEPMVAVLKARGFLPKM